MTDTTRHYTETSPVTDRPGDDRPGTPPGGGYEPPRDDPYGEARPDYGRGTWAYDDDVLFDDPRYYDTFGAGGGYYEEYDLSDYYDEDEGGFADDVAARGRDTMDSVLSTARENPVGTALVAAGVALLLAPRLERHDARAAMSRVRAETDEFGRRGASRVRGQRARLRHGMERASAEAEGQAARLRHGLERLRERINEGTETLGSDARDRVVAARMRTIAARERALDRADHLAEQARSTARHGAASARSGFQEHPLLAGALALTVGAAVGAALPRSRMEDSRFGALSDRLAGEAEAIYARERERLADAAGGAWEEAQRLASEAMESARETIPDGEKAAEQAEERIREGTSRIIEGARSGASGSGRS